MLKPILVAGTLFLLFLALGDVAPGGESEIALIEATPSLIFSSSR